MNKLEFIQEAKKYVSNLFEDDVNKIKRKKDKNTDIVSVEDELFPKEGTAKQQYNQKIIDKINEIIEGKATLEDLIQLVRQRKASKKKEATGEV